MSNVAHINDRSSKAGRELYELMVDSFDYTPVLLTAMREYPSIKKEDVKLKFFALLKWFSILPSASSDMLLQMNGEIDPLWHSFILNTKLYREFCNRFFGEYIDHDPMDPMNAEIAKRKYAKKTLELLVSEYGDDIHPAFLDYENIQCCYGACEDTPVDDD